MGASINDGGDIAMAIRIEKSRTGMGSQNPKI